MFDEKNLKRLQESIREAAYSDKELRELRLIHRGAKRQMQLKSEEYDPDTDPKSYAESFLHKAEHDAEGLGGVQQYSLQFFFGKNQRSTMLCRFSVRAEIDDMDSGMSEEATSTGMRSAEMRHNEGVLRIAFDVTKMSARAQGALLEKAYKRIEHLEDKLSKNFEIREQMISQQHERDMELRIQERSEERKDEMVEIVKVLAFPLVNKITGQKLLPESEGGNALAAFFDSLDMEQMAGLQGVLKPHQLGMVMAMMNEHLDSETKKKEEAADDGKVRKLSSGRKR